MTHPLFFVGCYGNTGEGVGTNSNTEYPVYDRYDTFALGGAEESDEQEGLRNRCYDCG